MVFDLHTFRQDLVYVLQVCGEIAMQSRWRGACRSAVDTPMSVLYDLLEFEGRWVINR
jgi:hypothetical protein